MAGHAPSILAARDRRFRLPHHFPEPRALWGNYCVATAPRALYGWQHLGVGRLRAGVGDQFDFSFLARGVDVGGDEAFHAVGADGLDAELGVVNGDVFQGVGGHFADVNFLFPKRGRGGADDDGVSLDIVLGAGGAPAEDGVVAGAAGDHGAGAASASDGGGAGDGDGDGGRGALTGAAGAGFGHDDGGLGREREVGGDYQIYLRDLGGVGPLDCGVFRGP